MGRLKPDSIKHLRTDSASAGNTSWPLEPADNAKQNKKDQQVSNVC